MTQIQIASLKQADIAYFDFPGTDDEKTILLIHGFASSAQVNWIGTGWVKLLNGAGYRVISIDNRGHGKSSKFYSPSDYGPDIFAADAVELLDHLDISTCDVMGYSMGARITAWLSYSAPRRFRKAIYGGMGSHIFGGRGGYELIAAALETDDLETISDPGAMAFRKFADATKSDRMALAACIRPSKHNITAEMVRSIQVPTLIAVGSEDEVGGSPQQLADMMPSAQAFTIEGLDHMKATGAESYKAAALEFLS
ncbi:MAG: alpha/beta fold hydrolase [Rhizobiaceae bacterium]|nr:alpha/beta fold hydrolase [Rhizobiaceae bacterium]